MRFSKIMSIIFSITMIFSCTYASEPKETMVFSKPQEYYVYSSSEGDRAKKIKVDKETLELFESLKTMFEGINYSREEEYNQPIQVPLVCSEQALEQIFDNLLSLRDKPLAFKQALNKLSLEELVDTINCMDILSLEDTSKKLDATGNLIKKVPVEVNVKDSCLRALSDKIVDIAYEFEKYVTYQGIYSLPNYESLRVLNTDINSLLEKYYDIKNTLWNRLKIVSIYLSDNPDHTLQLWQTKQILEVFDEISRRLTKSNPQKKIKEKKDNNFNYKAFLFAALLAAIAGGKKLWDLYKSRPESQ